MLAMVAGFSALLPVNKTSVSSTYRIMSVVLSMLTKSFMHKRKNNGPNTDPCGR